MSGLSVNRLAEERLGGQLGAWTYETSVRAVRHGTLAGRQTDGILATLTKWPS